MHDISRVKRDKERAGAEAERLLRWMWCWTQTLMRVCMCVVVGRDGGREGGWI